MKNENPIDHAYVVLQDAPITTDKKADIWDEVYGATNADDLARSLEAFDIPTHLVAALVTAKRLLDAENPTPSHADKVVATAHRMAQMDPKLLDVIEKHPNALKHLLAEPKKD